MNKTQMFPIDEGRKAFHDKKSRHSNPYKSPNVPKTDDVKSEAWLFGYSDEYRLTR